MPSILFSMLLSPFAHGDESDVDWGAVLELEASAIEQVNTDWQYDIVLATFAPSVNVSFSKWFEASISLLYEQNDTPLEVDEATVGINVGAMTTLKLGQMYLPFGQSPTQAVNDPLTLELGETRANAILITHIFPAFQTNLYILQRANEQGGARRSAIGLSAEWTKVLGSEENAQTNRALGVSLDYVSDIFSSDGLQGVVPIDEGESPGFALGYSFAQGQWEFQGEWLGFLERVDSQVFGANGATLVPSAYYSELNRKFKMLEGEANFGFGAQRSKDAVFLGLPKTRTYATLSTAFENSISLSAELFLDKNYDGAGDGGEAVDSGKSTLGVVLQIAAEI